MRQDTSHGMFNARAARQTGRTSSSTTTYCCQVPLPSLEGQGAATTRWSTWKRLAPAPFSFTTPVPAQGHKLMWIRYQLSSLLRSASRW